jgi:glutamyl-tRNA synthetase
MNTKVVTRFAPSPTGHMHAGSYRTAFFAYLYARKHGGTFILRIEDTDKERSKQEYTDEIFKVFETIGIQYDEKYIQSEHVARHKECLQQMIDNGTAYVSREEAKDGSGVMKDVIRFKNPNKVVVFDDLIRGPIATDTTDLGDFVIAKNIEEPLFHLAVVVDDHDEGVNHVIRAEEHIANTPRQILIHEALGFDIPRYAHLPLVLAPDKSKMSKRKGAVPVVEYLERGYLPEALLNAICLCGWNPGTEQELFTRVELEQVFDLDKVQKAGAVFNEEKLNWFNREYIKKLSAEEQREGIKKFMPAELGIGEELLDKLAPIIIERINYFGEVKAMADAGEFDYYVRRPQVDLEKVSWKGEGSEAAKTHLTEALKSMREIPLAEWKAERIKEALWPYAESAGRGSVLWPIRFTLSGKDKSPDPFVLADILGKDETIARIESLCEKL